MALWTVKPDIPRGRLWLQEAVNPADSYIYIDFFIWVYLFFSVSSWVLRNKSQVLTHLPPVVCPQDSLAAYAHTHKKKKRFFTTDDGYCRGEEAECLPSLLPSLLPHRSEWLLGCGLAVKLYSLFGWGWRYLVRGCRAACLFRNGWSCHVGFRDTSTDNNNGMQDSHTDPLVIVLFFFSFFLE